VNKEEESVFEPEIPNVPVGWEIFRFGDLIDIQGGSQPPKNDFIFEPREGYIRLLQIRDFGDKPVPTYVPRDMVSKFCDKEDIFIGRINLQVHHPGHPA
jgi:type I restriction enzyme S subunit